MILSFLLSKLSLFHAAAIAKRIARRGSCIFSGFSIAELKALSIKGLRIPSQENQPRTLLGKPFNILYGFREWIYVILNLLSRNRTLKTKYHKVFRLPPFQSTQIPIRD